MIDRCGYSVLDQHSSLLGPIWSAKERRELCKSLLTSAQVQSALGKNISARYVDIIIGRLPRWQWGGRWCWTLQAHQIMSQTGSCSSQTVGECREKTIISQHNNFFLTFLHSFPGRYSVVQSRIQLQKPAWYHHHVLDSSGILWF